MLSGKIENVWAEKSYFQVIILGIRIPVRILQSRQSEVTFKCVD